MTRTVGRGATVVMIAALIACASQLGMQIRAEQRPGTDFSRYATYAWRTAGLGAPAWPARNDRVAFDWRLRGLVDREMAQRGYAPAGSGGADLVLDYRVDTRETAIEDTFGEYARYRAEGGRQSLGDAWVQGYQEGTLVVEASDGRSRQLVWYGSATAVANPELREKRLPMAVQRIFERFPARR